MSHPNWLAGDAAAAGLGTALLGRRLVPHIGKEFLRWPGSPANPRTRLFGAQQPQACLKSLSPAGAGTLPLTNPLSSTRSKRTAGCGGAPDPNDEGQDRAGEPDLQHARAAEKREGLSASLSPTSSSWRGAERPQAGPGGHVGDNAGQDREGEAGGGGPRPDSSPPRAREPLVGLPCRSHTQNQAQQCCPGTELPARCSYLNLIQHNLRWLLGRPDCISWPSSHARHLLQCVRRSS